MPATCLVCGATKKSKVKLFHFAVITHKLSHLQEISKRRRHEWLRVLRRTEDDLKNKSTGQYVCSKHFISGEPAKVQDVTDPDWLPSLNLTPISDSVATVKRKAKKTRKLTERTGPLAAKYMKTAANTSVGMDAEQDLEESEDSVEESKGKVPDELATLMESMGTVKWILDQKDLLIHSLEAKLRHHLLDESSFVDDDVKTQFYTGFATYKCFASFVGVVGNYLPECEYPGVSKVNVLLMVMVKLRLNLPLAYMSLKFEIPFAPLCKIFTSSVNHLADQLHITWPSDRKVPKFLKDIFGRQLAAIVDVLELQLDYASVPYKTIKFLIAYSPCGRTAFVSKPFPGTCTDSWIVKKSGLMAAFKPSDIVLALRGTLNEAVVTSGGIRHKVFMYGIGRSGSGLVRLQWNDAHSVDVKNSLGSLMDQLTFGFLEHKQPEIWMKYPTDFLAKVVNLTAVIRNIILAV